MANARSKTQSKTHNDLNLLTNGILNEIQGKQGNTRSKYTTILTFWQIASAMKSMLNKEMLAQKT